MSIDADRHFLALWLSQDDLLPLPAVPRTEAIHTLRILRRIVRHDPYGFGADDLHSLTIRLADAIAPRGTRLRGLIDREMPPYNYPPAPVAEPSSVAALEEQRAAANGAPAHRAPAAKALPPPATETQAAPPGKTFGHPQRSNW